MVYSLGYFLRWDKIALFGLGVPIIALVVALVSATESPVFLVAQNKVNTIFFRHWTLLFYYTKIYILYDNIDTRYISFVVQIEEAKTALTRLYGPGYKVPEEVEIIRQNLKRRIEALGKC